MPSHPEITVTVAGTVHVLRSGEINALDATALRRAVGMSVRALFVAAAEDPDIDVVAAIVWLARRQAGERHLDYDTVASEIGYTTEVGFGGEAEVPDPLEVLDAG